MQEATGKRQKGSYVRSTGRVAGFAFCLPTSALRRGARLGALLEQGR